MSSLLETNLVETNLINIYKKMMGLDNILNISGNSALIGSLSINSTFYVSGMAYLSKSASVLSNLYVSNVTIINNALSLNSSLNVSGVTLLIPSSGSVTVGSSLNVSGNTIILGTLSVYGSSINLVGNTTIPSFLNVSGSASFKNSMIIENINSINNTINLQGPTINIGNSSSTVFINGTATYIASTTLQLIDKLIYINVDPTTTSAIDTGNLSGIEILGTSGFGYLQTNINSSRFIIKPPANPDSGYLIIQDVNNNMSLSGNSILNNLTSIGSSFNVSSNSLIYGNTTILASLYVSNNSTIQGSNTLNSSLNILNQTFLNNTTLLSNLNILNNTNISNNISLNSLLFVSNNTILNGNVTINNFLNISNNSIINSSNLVNNSLFVSNNSIFGNTSILSSLLVSSNTTIQNSVTNLSNFNVNKTSCINGNFNVNSNFLISGPTIITNNITLNSGLYILNQIAVSLPNYYSNEDAINAGVPLFGFYRTGGILKIRLDTKAPTLTLSGNSTISIDRNTVYTDPGVEAYSINSGYILPYITSLSSLTVNNVLSTPIAVSGPTIITAVSNLLVGTYNMIYTATDNELLTSSIARTLTITAPVPKIAYDLTNGYIGPITKSYDALNTYNWTTELWFYMYPRGSTTFHGGFIMTTGSSNELGSFNILYMYDNASNPSMYFIVQNNHLPWELTNLPVNQWTHFAWVATNNTISFFLNGINQGTKTIPATNFTIYNTSKMILGYRADNYDRRVIGKICQPLITLSPKYSANFTPQWDLTPASLTNVLFWLPNNVEQVTGQTIPINETVVQSTLTSQPF